MTWLLSAAGREAVACLGLEGTLLAFDLDGTLAPIVERPGDARVAPATAEKLKRLSARWPIAVITGRSREDAEPRLGFRPRYLFGNHGAQRPGIARDESLQRTLDVCRHRLNQQFEALRRHRILVEDKGLSIALHYRASPDRRAARGWLERFVTSIEPAIKALWGHCVMNLTPAAADDKGDALARIVRDCDARTALMVGDDDNDEPAFAKAPPGSVTVRIAEAGTPTLARYTLPAQSSVDQLLDLLLSLRPRSASNSSIQ